MDPIFALMQGRRPIEDRLLVAAQKLAQPFFGEAMLASAVMDAYRNQTEFGNKVYEENASNSEKAQQIAEHIASKVFEPGTIRRVRTNVLPAIGEQEVRRGGRVLDAKTETLSELTGIKNQKFNWSRGFADSSFRFTDAQKDIRQNFNRALREQRKQVSQEDIIASYQKYDAQNLKAWNDQYERYQAAIRQGVPKRDIYVAMTDRAGVSKDHARAIMAGKYIPLQVSIEIRRKLAEMGRPIPREVLLQSRQIRPLESR